MSAHEGFHCSSLKVLREKIMRNHGRTACAIRDAQIYGPLFSWCRQEAAAREKA